MGWELFRVRIQAFGSRFLGLGLGCRLVFGLELRAVGFLGGVWARSLSMTLAEAASRGSLSYPKLSVTMHSRTRGMLVQLLALIITSLNISYCCCHYQHV